MTISTENKFIQFIVRYACLFAYCYQTSRIRTATWVKGENRTLEGMADYQRQWLEETGGDRSKLCNFMNVEFAPPCSPCTLSPPTRSCSTGWPWPCYTL